MKLPGLSRGALAAALMLLAAGCAGTAHTAGPATAPAAIATTRAPALAGLPLRSALAQCTAQIEVGTAGGHDYSSDLPHSRDLPASCRPLNPGQLAAAVKRALRDMLNGGG